MRPTTACAAALWLAALVPAQGFDLTPAPELKKLNRLVGTWKNAGTLAPGPDATPMPWTSTTTNRWVLGGHFLRERTLIEGDGIPGSLQFVNYIGWNKTRGTMMNYSVSNTGEIAVAPIHWTDDNTMVTAATTAVQGQLQVDRWVTKLGTDTIEFVGMQAKGDGDFFVHVEGTGELTSRQPKKIETTDASFMADLTETPEKMTRFAGIAGEYQMKGWMVFMPGMPKMEISGSETVSPMFGKTIIRFLMKGDPIEMSPVLYEHEGYLAWDEAMGCYRTLFFNNMGEVAIDECHMAGDRRLIMTNATPKNGQPTVARHVMEFDGDGAITKFWTHTIIADATPSKVFEADYEKQ